MRGSKRWNKKHFHKVVEMFKRLGFLIQDQKVKDPARLQLVLGKYVCTRTMKIHVNQDKDKELLYIASIYRGEVQVRLLAKIVGKANSWANALTVPPILWFPVTLAVINQHVDEEDPKSWDTYVTVSPEMQNEFITFLAQYPLFSGRWVSEPPKGRFITSDMLKPVLEEAKVVSSDSGKDSSVILDVKSKEYKVVRFTANLQARSSSFRELMSLASLIQSDIPVKGTMTVFLTDSQVLGNDCCSILIWTSTFRVNMNIFQNTGQDMEQVDKKSQESSSEYINILLLLTVSST